MGVWDFINSSIDQTKQNAPNLSSIKNACWSSYNYTSFAVKKVDEVVRVDGIQRLYSYCPDSEGRAKIGVFVTKFTANAGRYAVGEGVKLLPGGKAVSKFVRETMRDMESESNITHQKKIMQDKDGLREDSKACTSSIDQSELLLKQDTKLRSGTGKEYEKPENVIRDFMATEFVGNHILADLMITKFHRVKKD